VAVVAKRAIEHDANLPANQLRRGSGLNCIPYDVVGRKKKQPNLL
jgi:hypothetical protein